MIETAMDVVRAFLLKNKDRAVNLYEVAAGCWENEEFAVQYAYRALRTLISRGHAVRVRRGMYQVKENV
jgi:anti-sigma regulatory factor (Ser/Thr protein kinase)